MTDRNKDLIHPGSKKDSLKTDTLEKYDRQSTNTKRGGDLETQIQPAMQIRHEEETHKQNAYGTEFKARIYYTVKSVEHNKDRK